ncbi:MAG: ChaN family lipoprotein, partial [Gammaproteobacteria bacterium]
INGLNDADKARLPTTIDRSNQAYEQRLRDIFAMHSPRGDGEERSFERFMSVQLIWDETMAQTAAEALAANPGARLVVLAGFGHVAGGHGIPDRLRRNLGPDANVVTAVMLSQGELEHEGADSRMADFLLLGPEAELPPTGKIGILMVDSEQGVKVADLAPDGAAMKAGLPKGSVIEWIDRHPVPKTWDVRIALFDKQPGDRVELAYREKPEEDLRTIHLELGGGLKHHPAPR